MVHDDDCDDGGDGCDERFLLTAKLRSLETLRICFFFGDKTFSKRVVVAQIKLLANA